MDVGAVSAADALSWWTALMGTGWLGAALAAWLGWRRARHDAVRQAPVLTDEARASIGCGIADRLAVERMDRLDETLAELGRAVERLFQAMGRQHGDIGDRIGRLGDRVERVHDEVREVRRAVEDLKER